MEKSNDYHHFFFLFQVLTKEKQKKLSWHIKQSREIITKETIDQL
jgi:hypothetical protein